LPNSDDSNADALADIGVKDSFKSYIFKSVEQKYARKVSFSQVALEQSLSYHHIVPQGTELNESTKGECSTELNRFKKDKFIDFDSRIMDTDAILEAIVVEENGKLFFKAKSSSMGSKRKIYWRSRFASHSFLYSQVRFKQRNLTLLRPSFVFYYQVSYEGYLSTKR
jgi:hypothetical protein